ncbi:hypothetical protein SCARD494_05215 [Seiridium cardinale]
MRLLTPVGTSVAGVVLSGLCSGAGVSFPIYNDLAHQDVQHEDVPWTHMIPPIPRARETWDSPFNVTYGRTPGNNVEGTYVNDTIEVGSIIIPDMTQIGAGNVPPTLFNASLWGIAGLGSPLQESVYSNPASPVYQQPH